MRTPETRRGAGQQRKSSGASDKIEHDATPCSLNKGSLRNFAESQKKVETYTETIAWEPQTVYYRRTG